MIRLRQSALLFFVMLVMLMATSVTLADNFGPDGAGIPDDPTDDNSCYPGGQWAGQCTNDYQWNAGWYHIRLMRGQITFDQVPDAYKQWMPQPAASTDNRSFPPVPPKPTDTDLDGVPDGIDACPATPGPIMNGGCPFLPPPPTDMDLDGVLDGADLCPATPGLPIYSGCPDSDGDGVPEDGSDWCPGQSGSAINNGCPDGDGDGVIDMMDSCPAAAGDPANRGCPDSDGDGFYDDLDMCVGIFSTSNFGCPADDSDFDGIPDGADLCPFSQAPPGDADGCPDEL